MDLHTVSTYRYAYSRDDLTLAAGELSVSPLGTRQ